MTQISVLGGEARFHRVSLLCHLSTALLPFLQKPGKSPSQNGLPDFQAVSFSSVSSAHPLETDVWLNAN